MKTLLTLLIILLAIGIVPISCIEDDCGDLGPRKFKITQLGIMTVNPESQEALDTTLTYPAEDISKLIYIEETQQVAAVQKSTYSFGSTAYACSPVEPYAIHEVQSIDIISNRKIAYADENDIIEINENLNDRFLISDFNHLPQQFVSIPNFLSRDEKIYHHEKFIIKAAAKPYQEVVLAFDMIIKMSDGTTFEFKDQIMKIE